MSIYDTTLISCDEAKLDEKNEIYRFFGEGRVFVDDADFTLECDEMEIHDADAEKTIYIKGSSTMVVYADKTAEAPGENATRRQRLEYALKQQDTTITFTDAEYNYDKEIFDAHGHVKFEQSDKYAQGDEFHGENKNEYALFKGACEFWQQNGLWLYEYKVVEDKEDPPSRGDKITRALLSVPSTITCDEAEGNSKDGWMQLRSLEGNIVYFKQDDKHAECRKFSLWYTEEEKEGEGQNEPEGPRDLLQPVEPEPEPEPAEPPTPRGFGSLPLLSDFPPDYVPPWQMSGGQPEPSVQMSSGETVEDAVQPSSGETEPEVEYPTSAGDVEDIVKSIETAGLSQAPADEGSPPETTPEIPAAQDYSFEFPEGETTPSGGTVGNLAELGGRIGEVTAEESGQESTAPHNEILMEGDVFVRQENGDWLFTYDIVREEDETKESIEQYKKWANASADSIHAWLDDNDVEATGSVKGEQDNQDLATDYLKYIGEFDMAYLRGNITVHREGKHQLMSQEGFIFFSTDIFEALGNVETKVIVDVEQQRSEAQGGTSEGQATAPAEGGETTPTPAPEGGGSTGGAPSG
jgi:lipopolysaccharide export system protein LptA